MKKDLFDKTLSEIPKFVAVYTLTKKPEWMAFWSYVINVGDEFTYDSESMVHSSGARFHLGASYVKFKEYRQA